MVGLQPDPKALEHAFRLEVFKTLKKEIKISELAEKSGCNKYHVVSAGVQMLYENVFESPEEEELQ